MYKKNHKIRSAQQAYHDYSRRRIHRFKDDHQILDEFGDAVIAAMNEYVEPHRSTRPYVRSALRARSEEEARRYVMTTPAGKEMQSMMERKGMKYDPESTYWKASDWSPSSSNNEKRRR